MEDNFENEMEIKFLGIPNNEAFARISVASFAATLDPTIEEISDIKTSVSEAVTNSIIHGYEKNNKGIVTIKSKIKENVVVIEVIDFGKGIENIKRAREPLYTTKPEEERSGMGFTIMENFMDEVDIISTLGQGTKVIMKKVIKQ